MAEISIYTSNLFSNAVAFIIVLFLTAIIGRITGKLLKRIFQALDFDPYLRKVTGISFRASLRVRFAVVLIIYMTGLVVAFERIGLKRNTLLIALLSIIIFIIVSIIVGFLHTLPSFFAGFYVRKKRFSRKGAFLKSRMFSGVVNDVHLTYIVLRKDDDYLSVPYNIIKSLHKNEALTYKLLRNEHLTD